MKLYRTQVASLARILFGIELAEGLKMMPQTEELAAAVEAKTEVLVQAHDNRLNLHRLLVRWRARRRNGEHRIDILLRQFFRALEVADGGRRGPLFNWMLPEGIGPVVIPVGQAQLDKLLELLGRMKRCTLPGAAEFLAVWLPKMEEGQVAFAGTLTEFLSARQAYLAAFQDEVAAREEHLLTVTKVKSLVQAALPGDRTLQEVVWPQQGHDSPEEKEDEEETGATVG